MEDLDHSGFAFDTNPMEFEALDSKMVKDVVKTILHNLKRKIKLLDERLYREKRTTFTGRQLCIRSSHSSISMEEQ